MRSRSAVGAGIIVALVAAVWVAVTAGGDDAPAATTTSTALPSTTTTSTSTTTTSTLASTTTATSAPTTTSGDEARVEEVRLIVQDLWFRWLHALYTNSEPEVADVVATEALLADFLTALDSVTISREPQLHDLEVVVEEILRDTPDCLVVHRSIDAGDLLAGDNISTGVDVLWPADAAWRLASGWSGPSDIWQNDCDGVREELP